MFPEPKTGVLSLGRNTHVRPKPVHIKAEAVEAVDTL